ncbi:VCBS domain-containing protein [Bradyrhizobium sp. BWA-3-5]|uniref:VCBS domain-containing protein n=1 Tax=Bradyrhizobium sp. BWA-3-5 TaxID=3080013 RepID=UPI00293F68AC|nr:VCBS domain-containing protein [Bradyrhizobium sp. BWA-3-5]WOH65378.1 VCBS domain-containing protein [Bradyrhizobium sp. BWA-3-5]
MAGDSIREGDVIETAADGQIAISLIDGTQFVLSHDTRVVFDGFADDPGCVSQSSLFAVDKGSFAFVAGRMAKAGSLRIETPVGSIRGRAQAGGFGMLSLTALTFAMMSDAKAADPDATFLDDDNIAYKDFEHGAFELWTKEAIPRHIIVEDPGETVVLTRKGSSVSVSQVTNSAARMEELQTAQQAVLANYAKGYGPGGSGTPYYLDLPKLQPINNVQSGGLIAPGVLPPLPEGPSPIVIEPFIPPPQPPSLNSATGPTLIDTAALDLFTASGGSFTASSSQPGATLTFGIAGGTAGNTVMEAITYNISKTGLYGTLYLNSTTGAYLYVPENAAVNALSVPTTENFTITVSDGTLSVSQTYTVIINGTNDAAIISGTASGAVAEAGGLANAAPGAPTASGTLTDTDVDNPANTFTEVSSATPSAKGYGTFTITAAGVWTYTVNDTNPAVQALNVGATLVDAFTVATIDGTTQVVTIIITGANDAAVISGAQTGTVIEASGTAAGVPVASGTLTDTDVDNAANSFAAVPSPTASNKGYGSFTMTAAGVWTYTLDNANAAVQALNAGERLTDTFTVATVDGTTQVVMITITGANDAAIISGSVAGSVVEATGTAAGIPVATGTLTASDTDNAANTFTAVSSPTASHNGYGTFTMTAAGVWTYTLDNTNPAVQALNIGATLTDTFTVTTVDGTLQVVTITIVGANDAAVISGATTGSVIEAGTTTPGTPTATGTLTDTDVDNAANSFTAVTSPTASSKGYGTFMITVAGVWTYMLDNNNGTVQALEAGQTLTDTFTVATIDGTTQTVTIVIHGSSDADPNDFDNLAQGDHVIVNTPYVYGTPNGENIAGGGDEFQIVYAGAGDDVVNGTGRDDILYSGSGNDTIKGNDGNDTIYGGSGNDTVNGNNGNDTITGGFGADRLTGSNGNDVFVYLSVADSNATQFDTITDFASGSDKINLAALGGLAFLHLTSTSTSVPPHTIAWIYDSASNETIVYVNPTGNTLKIGDSSLLEIHLQGVVSVRESDFIYQAATNAVAAAGEAIDVSLQLLAAEDAVLAAASAETFSETFTGSTEGSIAGGTSAWTLQAEEESFKFRFERDVETIDSVRLAHFGEAPTYATAVSEDEAAIAPAGASPAELWHDYIGTLTENHFTFHQAAINAGATVTGEIMVPVSIEPAGFMVGNVVATSQLVSNEVTPGSGANHQPPHEPHSAAQQAAPNDPHSVENAVPASQHAQHGVTPGGGANHQQSQHEPHAAAQQAGPNEPHSVANPVAASQLAQLGVTPGSGASHNQPPHELPAAALQAGSNNAHSASAPATSPGQSHQATSAGISPAPTVNEPGHGNSFQFKNTGFEPTGPAELAELGGPAAIPEIVAALSPAEEHAAGLSHVVQDHTVHSHAASHGSHELLV